MSTATVTITIDPGHYAGVYAVDVGVNPNLYMGKKTFPLSSGRHDIDNGSRVGNADYQSYFFFDIDDSGKIVGVTNPYAAQFNDTTITFNNTPIQIIPDVYGAQGGTYYFSSYPNTSSPKPQDFCVLPNLLYTIDNKSRVAGSDFKFVVDQQGHVISKGDAATGNQQTLKFNTTFVTITPVGYTGQYLVGGFGYQQGAIRLPLLKDTYVSLSIGTDSYNFHVMDKSVYPTQIKLGSVIFDLHV